MRLRCPRSALPVLATSVLVAVCAGPVAAGQAASGRASAGPVAAGQAAAGQQTAADSRAAHAAGIAAMLRAATGESPAQVSTASVCGAPAPGHASCFAQVLVTRGGHRLVRPRATVLSADSRRAHVLRALSAGARAGDWRAAMTPNVGRAVEAPATTLAEGGAAPYTPQFLQEAYDTAWLSGNEGAGATVAIVDAYGDPAAATDVNTYRSEFGLPAISTGTCSAATIATHSSGGPCMVVATQRGQTDPSSLPSANGWDGEQSLDLDAVSALCPNCNILLIQTDSNGDADLTAGDAEALRLGAKLISDSFGGAASSDGNGYAATDGYTAAEDATGYAAGSETFVATGDDGAYADGGYPGQTSLDQAPYPASEPYMTAVGGTSLTPDASARGVTETAWPGAGSACALNETQPSWQASAGTGCSGRATSDLSADADPSTGIWVYDSYAGGWGVYGGTSLAAPLTAAYVALTGINSGAVSDPYGLLSGSWAYTHAAQLNDITSGSSGSCTGSYAYDATQICNAGTGWDGPTGVGSISGDVVTSASGPSLTIPPAIGVDQLQVGYSLVQSVWDTGATFDGGVYPNGSATTVWWEYGSAAATGGGTEFSSATVWGTTSVAAGTAPVSVSAPALGGLAPSTSYYVEECASNNGGSDEICGNITEFTTADGPIAAGTAALTDSGLGYGGQISLGGQPTWTPSPTSIAYQWQESPDASNWSDVGTATSSPSSHTIALTDSRQYVRVAITATDTARSTTVYSDVVQVLNLAPSAGSLPTLSATSLVIGGVISVNTPVWSPAAPTSVAYQWQESADGISWTNISGANAASYTITPADSGKFIRIAVAASNAAGSAAYYSAPVLAENLGSRGSASQSGGNPSIIRPPTLRGRARVGSKIFVRGGSYVDATAVRISFERCSHRCVVVQSGRSTHYRLRAADAGHYLIAQVSVIGSAGAVKGAARGLIGPVISGRVGALRIRRAQATLTSGAHRPLVNVRRTTLETRFHRRGGTYLLALTRARGATGRITVVLCWRAGATLAACSAPLRLVHSASFSAAVKAGQSLELIAGH